MKEVEMIQNVARQTSESGAALPDSGSVTGGGGAPTKEFPASRLCDMASDFLSERYPGALIIREFSVGDWGGALIDIAAVTKTEIIGVEIKGDGDGVSRLKLQTALYSKAAQRMYLLPSPSLTKLCKRNCWSGWRLLCVQEGKAVLDDPNSWSAKQPPPLLPTAPAQLLQALWRDELYFLARELGIGVAKAATVGTMLQAISTDAPLSKIIPGVCRHLRGRPWVTKGLAHKVTWAPLEDAA